MRLETFSEAQIVSMLRVHYQNGVRVRPGMAIRSLAYSVQGNFD